MPNQNSVAGSDAHGGVIAITAPGVRMINIEQ
jgi:hypothetical protein